MFANRGLFANAGGTAKAATPTASAAVALATLSSVAAASFSEQTTARAASRVITKSASCAFRRLQRQHHSQQRQQQQRLISSLRLQQQQQRRLLTAQTKPASASNAAKEGGVADGAAKAAGTKGSSGDSASGSSKGGFIEWYEGHLQARPVPTKMITGTILWGIGDAVAQVVPQLVAKKGDDDKKEKKPLVYDWPRTGRAAFFGFALHAPLSHLHFNFLEWLTIKAGVTGLKIPVFKAFMEQFVYWSWVSNTLYHGAMGAMLGMNAEQIYNRIADVLWETQKAQWAFWIPVQLLNFRFVPVRHQLNVVLVTSVAWTALLSAWYPPEDSDEDKQDKRTDNGKKQE